MKKLFLFVILLSTSLSLEAQLIKLTNGQWFNGETFVVKDMWIEGEYFLDPKGRKADSIIDLQQQYVVPPFCEAHNHSIDQAWGLPFKIKNYLSKGIFYYKNPNSIPLLTRPILKQLNHPQSLDVVFANGGLTGTDGHPKKLYERLWNNGMSFSFMGKTKKVLKNQAYWIIDTEEDLEAQWDSILKGEPDFIKIYLLFSDDYEKRKDDTTLIGAKGLNPAVAKKIVDKAHEYHLRVSVHVETAIDFQHAVAIGVDEINHLPSYSVPWAKGDFSYLITKEDAQMAAEKNISVIGTYSLMPKISGRRPQEAQDKARETQIANLSTLKEAGVNIAIGCDDYMGTSMDEAMYIAGMGIFSNVEMLNMFTIQSIQTIFPDKKLGKLEEAYRADFLVLTNNPLEDFEHIEEISWMVKQGKRLKP